LARLASPATSGAMTDAELLRLIVTALAEGRADSSE
jgi:hypothetical protein